MKRHRFPLVLMLIALVFSIMSCESQISKTALQLSFAPVDDAVSYKVRIDGSEVSGKSPEVVNEYPVDGGVHQIEIMAFDKDGNEIAYQKKSVNVSSGAVISYNAEASAYIKAYTIHITPGDVDGAVSYTLKIDDGAIESISDKAIYFRGDDKPHKVTVYACNALGDAVKTEEITVTPKPAKSDTFNVFEDSKDPDPVVGNVTVSAFDGMGKGIIRYRLHGAEGAFEVKEFKASEGTSFYLEPGNYDFIIDIYDSDGKIVKRMTAENKTISKNTTFNESDFASRIKIEYTGNDSHYDILKVKDASGNMVEPFTELECGHHKLEFEGYLNGVLTKPVAKGTKDVDVYFSSEDVNPTIVIDTTGSLKKCADVGILKLDFAMPAGCKAIEMDVQLTNSEEYRATIEDIKSFEKYIPVGTFDFNFKSSTDSTACFNTEFAIKADVVNTISTSNVKLETIFNVSGLLKGKTLKLTVDGSIETITLDSEDNSRNVVKSLFIGEHTVSAILLDAEGKEYAKSNEMKVNVGLWEKNSFNVSLTPIENALKLDFHITPFTGAEGYKIYLQNGDVWNCVYESGTSADQHIFLEKGKTYNLRCDALKNGAVIARSEKSILLDKASTIAFDVFNTQGTVDLKVTGVDALNAAYVRVDVNGKTGDVVPLELNNGEFSLADTYTAGDYDITVTFFNANELDVGVANFKFELEPNVTYKDSIAAEEVVRNAITFNTVSLLPEQTRTVVTLRGKETLTAEINGLGSVTLTPKQYDLMEISIEAFNGDISLGKKIHAGNRYFLSSKSYDVYREQYDGKVAAELKVNPVNMYTSSEYSLDGENWFETGEKDSKFVVFLDSTIKTHDVSYRTRNAENIIADEGGVIIELKADEPWYSSNCSSHASDYGRLELIFQSPSETDYHVVTNRLETRKITGSSYEADMRVRDGIEAKTDVEVIAYNAEDVPLGIYKAEVPMAVGQLTSHEAMVELQPVLKVSLDPSSTFDGIWIDYDNVAKSLDIDAKSKYVIFKTSGKNVEFGVDPLDADGSHVAYGKFHKDLHAGYNGELIVDFAPVVLDVDVSDTPVDQIIVYKDGTKQETVNGVNYHKELVLESEPHTFKFEFIRKGSIYAVVEKTVDISSTVGLSISSADIVNEQDFKIDIYGEGVKSVLLDGQNVGNGSVVVKTTPGPHVIVVDGVHGSQRYDVELSNGENGGVTINYTNRTAKTFTADITGYDDPRYEWRAYVGDTFTYSSSLTDGKLEVGYFGDEVQNVWIGAFINGKLHSWGNGNTDSTGEFLLNVKPESSRCNLILKLYHEFNPGLLHETPEIYLDVARAEVELWRFDNKIGVYEGTSVDAYSSEVTITDNIALGPGYRAHVRLYDKDGKLVADSHNQAVSFTESGAHLNINQATGKGKLSIALFGHTEQPTVLLGGNDITSLFTKSSSGIWSATVERESGIYDLSVTEGTWNNESKVRILSGCTQYVEQSKMGGGIDIGHDIQGKLLVSILDGEGKDREWLELVYSNQNVVASAKVTGAGPDLKIEWIDRGKVVATGTEYAMPPRHPGRNYLTVRATSGGRIATDTVHYDVDSVTDLMNLYVDGNPVGSVLYGHVGSGYQYSAAYENGATGVEGSDSWILVSPDGSERKFGGSNPGEKIPSTPEALKFPAVGDFTIKYIVNHLGVEQVLEHSAHVSMPSKPDVYPLGLMKEEYKGNETVIVDVECLNVETAKGWRFEWWMDGQKVDVPVVIHGKNEFTIDTCGSHTLNLKGTIDDGEGGNFPLVDFGNDVSFTMIPAITWNTKPTEVYPGQNIKLDCKVEPKLAEGMKTVFKVDGVEVPQNSDGSFDIPYILATKVGSGNTSELKISVENASGIVEAYELKTVFIWENPTVWKMQLKTPFVSMGNPFSAVLDKRITDGSVDWYLNSELYKADTKGFFDGLYNGNHEYGEYRLTAIIKDASGKAIGYAHSTVMISDYAPSIEIKRDGDRLNASFLGPDGKEIIREFDPTYISWKGSAGNYLEKPRGEYDIPASEWTELGTGYGINVNPDLYSYIMTIKTPEGMEMSAARVIPPVPVINGNNSIELKGDTPVTEIYTVGGHINWDWMADTWTVDGPAGGAFISKTAEDGKVEVQFTSPGRYILKADIGFNGKSIAHCSMEVLVGESVVAASPRSIWMSNEPHPDKAEVNVIMFYSDDSWTMESFCMAALGKISGNSISGKYTVNPDGSYLMDTGTRVPVDGVFVHDGKTYGHVKETSTEPVGLKGSWRIADVKLGSFAEQFVDKSVKMPHADGYKAYGKPVVEIDGVAHLGVDIVIDDGFYQNTVFIDSDYKLLETIPLHPGIVTKNETAYTKAIVGTDKIQLNGSEVRFEFTEDGVLMLLQEFHDVDGVMHILHVPLLRNEIKQETAEYIDSYQMNFADIFATYFDIYKLKNLTDQEFSYLFGRDISAGFDGSRVEAGKWKLSDEPDAKDAPTFSGMFGSEWFILGSDLSEKGSSTYESMSNGVKKRVISLPASGSEYKYAISNVRKNADGSILFDIELAEMIYGPVESTGQNISMKDIKVVKIMDDPNEYVPAFTEFLTALGAPPMEFRKDGNIVMMDGSVEPMVMGTYAIYGDVIEFRMGSYTDNGTSHNSWMRLGFDALNKKIIFDADGAIGLQLHAKSEVVK